MASLKHSGPGFVAVKQILYIKTVYGGIDKMWLMTFRQAVGNRAFPRS